MATSSLFVLWLSKGCFSCCSFSPGGCYDTVRVAGMHIRGTNERVLCVLPFPPRDTPGSTSQPYSTRATLHRLTVYTYLILKKPVHILRTEVEDRVYTRYMYFNKTDSARWTSLSTDFGHEKKVCRSERAGTPLSLSPPFLWSYDYGHV